MVYEIVRRWKKSLSDYFLGRYILRYDLPFIHVAHKRFGRIHILKTFYQHEEDKAFKFLKKELFKKELYDVLK